MNKNVYGYNYKIYEMIRSNGGWDMFSMVLIHKFPCNSKLEAYKEEDKVMRELKATMNTKKALCDNKKNRKTKEAEIINPLMYLNELNEYFKKIHKQEYVKEYYLKNREHKIEILKKMV